MNKNRVPFLVVARSNDHGELCAHRISTVGLLIHVEAGVHARRVDRALTFVGEYGESLTLKQLFAQRRAFPVGQLASGPLFQGILANAIRNGIWQRLIKPLARAKQDVTAWSVDVDERTASLRGPSGEVRATFTTETGWVTSDPTWLQVVADDLAQKAALRAA